MSLPLRRALLACLAAGVGLAATVAGAPSAQAIFPGYTYFVRPGDFVRPTGTSGDATVAVETDGVHIHTGDPGALAAGTFVPPGGPVPLGDFNMYGYQVTYTWTGSADQPAIHYDIDLDGDGVADMELVGEHKYGDDLWLNEGFYVANPTVPLSVVQAAAPCVDATVRAAPRQGCNATYGGPHHGGIYDWTSGLEGQGFTDADVVTGGFVATGGQVDGVLSSLNLGIYRYVFTSDRLAPATISLSTDTARVAPGGTVVIHGVLGDTAGYPTVVLQRQIAGRAWKTVDTTRLFYGFSFVEVDTAPAKPATVRYRVIVPASNANLRSVSRPLQVRVAR